MKHITYKELLQEACTHLIFSIARVHHMPLADSPICCHGSANAHVSRQVSRFANLLKSLNVKKGDRVALYMPMVPQAAYAMLACARIGAVHKYVLTCKFPPQAVMC